MELKNYQKNTLVEVEKYLVELVKAREGQQKVIDKLTPEEVAALPAMNFTKTAWDKVTGGKAYYPKKNGLGENIPDFYIKLPTGGGKTLLACHTIESVNRIYLKKRTGMVLWIVPTETIYRQTLDTLSDRAHPYRQALDIASAGRTVIREKADRFTPEDVAENLVVLLLMLPSANRVNKEVLRMFKDSGGFTDFFPEEDDIKGHAELIKAFPNLDSFGQAEGFYGQIAKTSLGNTLKILKPVVIIDEGHKAYTGSAQQTIMSFNPSLIIELSATPPEQCNKLVEVWGTELEKEGMIKLDLHVYNESTLDWKDVLRKTWNKRRELEEKALEYEANSGIYIRPMCLIQVERTGADQRGARYLHAEEVREHLIKTLGVKPEEVAVKSSDTNDIEGLDLMSRDAQIKFIITKQALQEGWDAPFAYVLSVLTNPQSQVSLTQLVGRILRQPYAVKTKVRELDESYVFCNKPNAPALLEEIRKGFQADGMGDLAGRIAIDYDDISLNTTTYQSIGYRAQFKPFEGKIYLPRFVMQEKDQWRELDYDMDILRRVEWAKADLNGVKALTLAKREMAEHEIVIGLAGDKNRLIQVEDGGSRPDDWRIDHVFITRQLLDIVPNPWVAHEMGKNAIKALTAKFNEDLVKSNLSFIIEELRKCLMKERDRLAEEIFRDLVKSKTLYFFLVAGKGGYALPSSLLYKSDSKRLIRDDNSDIQLSLFEKVAEESINGLERKVAFCLDRQVKLLWWYRNLAKQNYFIQGWRKGKIYPDFIFTEKSVSEPTDYDTIYVVETKGDQLAGNLDTKYKESVFNYCNELGTQKEWRKLNAEFGDKNFEFHVVYGEEAEKRINEILA